VKTRHVGSLLLAAALGCGGTSHPRSAPDVPKPDQPGDPVAPVPTLDPNLTARQAYVDPGGMWMPRQMTLPIHAANLAAMGVALPAATLADPTAPPLGAVVSLGGCTGSFVSADGLIITNHHCVQTALQVNSTPDHNYVEDGYLAKTRADELPAGPSQHVYVTQASRDVTKEMTDGLAAIVDPGQRTKDVERRDKALVAACEKNRPGVKCEVVSFYRGAEWQLIESLEIRDVRVVHAPHRSIGNYGGEIDNWAWPRHVADYSFLRAYVGKDGKSADPSPDNVPYHPPHWLTLATKPLAESDFVMVAGYPGQTERIKTYSEVQFDVDWTYPETIAQIQEAYDTLEQLAKQGGMTAIKANMFKQFVQNALENQQGTLAGLKKGPALATKKAMDASVRAWAAQPGRDEYAQAIDALEATFVEARATVKNDSIFGRAANGSTLLSQANLVVRMAEERPKKDADRKAGFQARDLPDLIAAQSETASQYDPDIDRAFMRLALVRALALPEADRPWLATMLAAGKGQAIDAALIDRRIGEWFAASKLADPKVALALLKKASSKQLAASKDPFIRIAVALRPTLKMFEERSEKRAGDRLLLAPKYAIAMRESLAGALAPDANSTLRITYGTVKRRGPGLPFTLASEIPAKDTGAEPFDAPAALLSAVAKKQWGPYADATLGGLPVDFLTDVDTTGGNSGSPTMNDRGELVGLLFDGTIESVSSNVVFDPAITRSIHADIRYALWVMDAIEGADNVLTELGVTPRL
jgi:Peptidase S46